MPEVVYSKFRICYVFGIQRHQARSDKLIANDRYATAYCTVPSLLTQYGNDVTGLFAHRMGLPLTDTVHMS
jgi:hypothetical protein